MISRIKKALISITALMAIAAPFAITPLVHAAGVEDGLCQGANLQLSAAGTTCDITPGSVAAEDKINTMITTVINIFSIVVGVVSVIMIIIGGLKYITSGGDSGNVTGAKNTILYAIIGLVVVALSQFIVKVVLGRTLS